MTVPASSGIEAALEREARELWQRWLSLRNFESRATQWDMIEKLLATLQHVPDAPTSHLGDILMDAWRPGAGMDEDNDLPHDGSASCVAVEAPTGTGKTIAYLLAGLLCAHRTRRKLVVVTSTVALQRQIMESELPSLWEAAELDSSYALVKGRKRYLCLLRARNNLAALSAEAAQVSLWLDGKEQPIEPQRVDLYRSLVEKAEDESWDGDFDTWEGTPIQEEDRRLMSVGNDECTRRDCSMYDRCCYYRALERLDEADCIVANYALMLSDRRFAGGRILPRPEQSIYILDEAHKLNEITCEHHACHIDLHGSRERLSELRKTSADVREVVVEDVALLNARDCFNIGKPLRELGKIYRQAFSVLRDQSASLQGVRDGRETRFYIPAHAVPEDLRRLAAQAVDCHRDLIKRFERIRREMREWAKSRRRLDGTLPGDWSFELGRCIGDLNREIALWEYYAQPSWTDAEVQSDEQITEDVDRPPLHPPDALWFEAMPAASPENYRLCAQPTRALKLLDWLWQSPTGIVATSASLCTAGSFEYFQSSVGLPEHSALHVIDASFDYRRSAELLLADFQHDPSEPGFPEEAATYLGKCLVENDGGTLVLFSSRRQMEAIYELIDDPPRHFVLVQHAMPLPELLETHRGRIDDSEPSALFGLDSFAEGMDLPGKYCTQLVIARIPFAPPNTPRMLALRDWYERQDRRVFDAVSVPEAGLRLYQWCGRLLRREDDSGRIVLLDKRIRTKYYGRILLDALPGYERVIE